MAFLLEFPMKWNAGFPKFGISCLWIECILSKRKKKKKENKMHTLRKESQSTVHHKNVLLFWLSYIRTMSQFHMLDLIPFWLGSLHSRSWNKMHTLRKRESIHRSPHKYVAVLIKLYIKSVIECDGATCRNSNRLDDISEIISKIALPSFRKK